MNFFIVFLLPSVFGLIIFKYLNKIENICDILISYLTLTLFSNYIGMIYLAYTKKMEIDLIEYASSNYIFCVKYMTILLLVNFFLAIIFTLIKKYLFFSIEVENVKKENKKN